MVQSGISFNIWILERIWDSSLTEKKTFFSCLPLFLSTLWCDVKKNQSWLVEIWMESSALNPLFCVLKKYAAVFSIDSISFHWEVEIDLFINTKLFEKTLIEYIFYWIHWIIRDACPCPSPENFQDCPAPPQKCPEFNCYPALLQGFYSMPCPARPRREKRLPVHPWW